MATTRSMKLLFSAGAPPGPRPPSRRSRRSLPPPAPPAPPPRRCGPGIRRPSRSAQRCSSEVQPTLAGTVGQGRDAAGVPVATTVEDDGRDAGGLRPVGDQGADLAGQGGLVALGAARSEERRVGEEGRARGAPSE